MTASIEAYSPTGELVFSSQNVRCVRLKGVYPITWKYDSVLMQDSSAKYFQFKGQLPVVVDESKQTAFNGSYLMQGGQIIGIHRGSLSDNQQTATTAFLKTAPKTTEVYVY